MFDYEWATLPAPVNCRLARRVVVPDAIPPARLARYGAPRKLARLPGPEGGVLPRGLRAVDPAVLGELGPRPARADRRRAHAAVGLALPPLRERALRGGARARPRRPGGRAAAGRRPARRARARRRLHRARPRDRRAVADRVRRSRDQRRRHDEPRGGRARDAGLDHVRGPPRRGRRAADRRRAGMRRLGATRADRAAQARPGARAGACGATPACSSRSCLAPARAPTIG